VGAHESEERGGVRPETGGDVLLHFGQHRVLPARLELYEGRAFRALRVDVDRGEAGGIGGAGGA